MVTSCKQATRQAAWGPRVDVHYKLAAIIVTSLLLAGCQLRAHADGRLRRVAKQPASIAFVSGDSLYLTGPWRGRRLLASGLPFYRETPQFSYQWSPSGRFLLVQSRLGVDARAWLFNPHGRRIRSLGGELRHQFASAISWAIGSDRLVFQSELSWVVYQQAPLGSPTRVWPPQGYGRPVIHGCLLSASLPDPAADMWLAELQGMTPSLLWDPARHELLYGCGSRGRWASLDTTTAAWRGLGTSTQMPVSISSTGEVAGYTNTGGPCPFRCDLVVQSSSAPKAISIGPGFAPAWSPNGRWLYYVTIDPRRLLSLRISYFGHPVSTKSSVNTVTVWRIGSQGQHRQKVGVASAYGFARLNVSRTGEVVLCKVGTDLGLLHLPGRVITPADVNRFGPRCAVYSISEHGRNQVLIADARFPAVRP